MEYRECNVDSEGKLQDNLVRDEDLYGMGPISRFISGLKSRSLVYLAAAGLLLGSSAGTLLVKYLGPGVLQEHEEILDDWCERTGGRGELSDKCLDKGD